MRPCSVCCCCWRCWALPPLIGLPVAPCSGEAERVFALYVYNNVLLPLPTGMPFPEVNCKKGQKGVSAGWERVRRLPLVADMAGALPCSRRDREKHGFYKPGSVAHNEWHGYPNAVLPPAIGMPFSTDTLLQQTEQRGLWWTGNGPVDVPFPSCRDRTEPCVQPVYNTIMTLWAD